jgi:nitroreductase/FMN reductase [NAD(P)H]
MLDLDEALRLRFGPGTPAVPDVLTKAELPKALANRRSHRRFKSDPVEPELIHSLCALALCAPTKSDLQQRDIVIMEDPGQRARLHELIPGNDWTLSAPAFLVFCADNRRQRLIHQWREPDFANDHLDAFFNASVDAGIVLATFVLAAESVGLGCCPISAIRNEAARVSELLDLPDHVFPIAGLALGWPSQEHEISLRLPLETTVYSDRYSEENLRENIAAYDARREAHQPFGKQKHTEDFGEAERYGWSEDKARQYSRPQRTDFGNFIRAKGFNLS